MVIRPRLIMRELNDYNWIVMKYKRNKKNYVIFESTYGSIINEMMVM